MGLISVDKVGLLLFSFKFDEHCVCCLWSCMLSSYSSTAGKVPFHV
jgi:hypothetical protein